MSVLPELPFSDPVRLNQIPGGVTRTLEPDVAARARIARALDLASLDAFVADISLKPAAEGWRLSGRVKAARSRPVACHWSPCRWKSIRRFRSR